MNLLLPLRAVTVLCVLAAVASAQAAPLRRALLVPMPSTASWQDLAFLAAVPAASVATGGKPVVLSVGLDGALSAEARDFLARYRPERLVWVGAGPDSGTVDGVASEHLAALTADAAACALAERFFPRSSCAVVSPEGDYSGALAAAALAARSGVPLLFCGSAGLSAPLRATLERIGATELLLVGNFGEAKVATGKAKVERLRDPVEVALWMREHDLPVEYLAAAAPKDRVAGQVRKLSLAAAVLAAGRQGAVVTIGAADAPAPSVAAVRDALERCGTALGRSPEYLCLVAMPEAIPMAVIPSGEGIDTDPPSDLSYGNVDPDPFLELATGRFVAEDGPAGTLLAARSLAYADLLTPDLAGRFAVAEWERLCAPLFTNVGFEPPAVHEGGKMIEQDSPLASVSVLVHNAHSSWFQLGATYAHDSRVLLSPCLVESAGCSPAALDQDPEHRSVALRLLRNGAVAFVGNVRKAVAQHELYRSEFWNAVLVGKSLGQANRDARNRALVAVLAHDETEHGLHRYQLYNAAFYGDPALVLHLPRAPKTAPANVEVRGRDVIVNAPAEWWRGEQVVPAEWNYTDSPVIYSWRGAGVGIECSWDAEHRRNRDVLVFTAEVRTRRRVHGLAAIKAPPAPLGWDGRHFIDEHADGSRSVYFRVRLIDFDMATGTVLQQVKSLRFRLE